MALSQNDRRSPVASSSRSSGPCRRGNHFARVLFRPVRGESAGRGPGESACGCAVERLIHLRAKRVVVATGAYEVPFPFANNDLPGVMLSTAVQRLIHLHGIKPGNRAVVVASGSQGDEVAAELREARS